MTRLTGANNGATPNLAFEAKAKKNTRTNEFGRNPRMMKAIAKKRLDPAANNGA